MSDDRHQARLRFRLRPASTSRRGFDGGRDEPLGLAPISDEAMSWWLSGSGL